MYPFGIPFKCQCFFHIAESVVGFKELYREPVVVPVKRPSSQAQQRDYDGYQQLEAEDRELVDALLRGALPLEHLPRLRPRVVTLYVVSAGTGWC